MPKMYVKYGDATTPSTYANLKLTTTGSAVGLLSPTRTGYTFAGWYTATSGGSKVTSYTGSSAVTYYAHWTANTYTVSYNKGTATGGTLPSNQTATYNASITLGTNSMTKSNTN